MKDPRIQKLCLYAWVEVNDGDGSAEPIIKKASVAAGLTHLTSILVSTSQEQIDTEPLKTQFQTQASAYNKTIRLCKFVYNSVIEEITPA